MLRFDSPVQLTTRWASTALAASGHRLPAGATVSLIVGAADRDPARFAAPGPGPPRQPAAVIRRGRAFLPRRGAALARREGRIAFDLLATRFPGIAATGASMRRDRLVLRGFARLPVPARPAGGPATRGTGR